jgi:hypothetical protein
MLLALCPDVGFRILQPISVAAISLGSRGGGTVSRKLSSAAVPCQAGLLVSASSILGGWGKGKKHLWCNKNSMARRMLTVAGFRGIIVMCDGWAD